MATNGGFFFSMVDFFIVISGERRGRSYFGKGVRWVVRKQRQRTQTKLFQSCVMKGSAVRKQQFDKLAWPGKWLMLTRGVTYRPVGNRQYGGRA